MRGARGVVRSFTPAKLVIPTLLSAGEDAGTVADALSGAFGSVDYRSPEIPFTFTDYYTAEMGAGLRRVFFTISGLRDPSGLAELKLRTGELERRLSHYKSPDTPAYAETPDELSCRRTVNLDPGFLFLGKLILASTKDNAQRIPLHDGVYAEITLLYKKGRFEPLPWTYPDYRSDAYAEILSDIRSRYKRELEADTVNS
ncbi:MAG: DUF4416 family protein [Spirochaetaceae bacterium]